MDKINQIVITEPEHIEIRTADMPVCGPDDVLLKLLYGGICGSDLAVYKGIMPWTEYPRITGHEFSAEVIDFGCNVKDLERGAIVTGNPYFGCGKCYSCRRGLNNCCVTNRTCGVQRDGIFSDYIAFPRDHVYDSKGLDPRLVALVEPFSNGYRAALRARISKGDRVLVVGGGTIGITAAMSAVYMGAEVTVCDIAPEKLHMAPQFGVKHTILNDGSRPLAEMVAELTDGDGFDVAIEAAGLPQTVKDCIESVAYDGRVVVCGVIKHETSFQFDIIRNNYLQLIGSRNALKEDFETVFEIFRSGQFPIERMISRVFPAVEAADAYDYFAHNVATNFKVMLKF